MATSRSILRRLAESGTAPDSGCLRFGVGYDEAFARLTRVYVQETFAAGDSSEKFVVGPFGSGKTHFMRQLMELARADGCVTSEVVLSKNVDFTRALVVYKELCLGIVTPDDSGATGMRLLLLAIARKISGQALYRFQAEQLLAGWTEGLRDLNFDLPAFGRVLQRAFRAHLGGERDSFDAAVRWLAGDASDALVCKKLEEARVTRSEENLHAQRATASLFQLIRHAGYQGTVVGFDEAEQGLQATPAKTARILSMLQSGLNAVADLKGGSALLVYALTPDLFNRMQELPALQQRVADPGPGRGFFDGNTLAVRIDLAQREAGRDLGPIASKLVGLLYEEQSQIAGLERTSLEEEAQRIAKQVASDNVGSDSRRVLVKRVASMLLQISGRQALGGALQDGSDGATGPE
jgi:hypothetical protein